jgi:hypothetical protein
VFVISDAVETAKLNPWWKCEFLDPMVTINLSVDHINKDLLPVKEELVLSIGMFSQFWENRQEVNEVINRIRDLKSLSEIIIYLMKIRRINCHKLNY